MNHQRQNRKRGRRTAGALALVVSGVLLGGALAAHAGRDDATLFQDTFEADTNGWMVFGPHAHIGRTNEAGKVKNGKSALAFNYRFDAVAPNPGEPPIDAILRSIPDGQLAKARSLSFWARSDINAPIALALAERNGGRYLAMTWLPKNQWQHIVFAPDDFTLTEGKDDPKDPDGKLDMDQVENITLLNLYSFVALGAKDNPATAALFPAQSGEHTLWIDDFTASSAPPAFATPEPAPPVEKSGVWVDSLRQDTLAWLPLGAVEMQMDKDAPTKSRAIRLDYTQEMGKFAAVVHDLNHANLSRYDHLEFDVASSKAGKLLIALEEKNGSRYNAIIDMAGDGKPARKVVYFANFAFADDSPKDPDGKLDLDQLKNLSIADITGYVTMQKQANTLWIGPIRASQSK